MLHSVANVCQAFFENTSLMKYTGKRGATITSVRQRGKGVFLGDIAIFPCKNGAFRNMSGKAEGPYVMVQMRSYAIMYAGSPAARVRGVHFSFISTASKNCFNSSQTYIIAP